MTNAVEKIVSETAKLLNATLEALGKLRSEMDAFSSQLPEYDTVMSLYGVSKVFCSQLIAEIVDLGQFKDSELVLDFTVRPFDGISWTDRGSSERILMSILFAGLP